MKSIVAAVLIFASISANAGIKIISVNQSACPGDTIEIKFSLTNQGNTTAFALEGGALNMIWQLPETDIRALSRSVSGADTIYTLKTRLSAGLSNCIGRLYSISDPSDVHYIDLSCGKATGIQSYNQDKSNARYFDLYGNRLIRPLSNTLMIEYRDGKATKTIRIE